MLPILRIILALLMEFWTRYREEVKLVVSMPGIMAFDTNLLQNKDFLHFYT